MTTYDNIRQHTTAYNKSHRISRPNACNRTIIALLLCVSTIFDSTWLSMLWFSYVCMTCDSVYMALCRCFVLFALWFCFCCCLWWPCHCWCCKRLQKGCHSQGSMEKGCLLDPASVANSCRIIRFLYHLYQLTIHGIRLAKSHDVSLLVKETGKMRASDSKWSLEAKWRR